MVSKQEEQLLNQAQVYQQQIQSVLTQKGALTLELNEIKKALEEIEKTKEKTVFKISGPILIRAEVSTVKKELKEKEDFINLRLKSIEKQEEKLKEKIEELRRKLLSSQTRSE
jgi:prefoldin beta subunit